MVSPQNQTDVRPAETESRCCWCIKPGEACDLSGRNDGQPCEACWRAVRCRHGGGSTEESCNDDCPSCLADDEQTQADRITDVSHAMLDRAFVRDDRDLLLQIRDRLRAAQTEGDLWSPPSAARLLASQILDLYPDDLREAAS